MVCRFPISVVLLPKGANCIEGESFVAFGVEAAGVGGKLFSLGDSEMILSIWGVEELRYEPRGLRGCGICVDCWDARREIDPAKGDRLADALLFVRDALEF